MAKIKALLQMGKNKKVITDDRKLRLPVHLKIFMKNRGAVYTYVGRKKSQIYARLKAIPRQNVEKYYLRVVYGKAVDNHGKMVVFDNSGTYKNRTTLLQALSAFTERDLLKEWL